MNNKLAIAIATSTMLLGSAAVAQTAPNVSGDPSSTLVVTPAAPGAAPTTTTRSTVSGSTRTDTTVTVTPKAAPMAAPTTGAGEAMVAGERG
jgi:hypothetical protein